MRQPHPTQQRSPSPRKRPPASPAARTGASRPAATLLAAAALAALQGLAAPAALAQSTDTVQVLVNHARVVRLPEKTGTVVVGNPSIADVAMQKNGNLVITGKAYGLTNLIALDPGGNIIAESKIKVDAPSDAIIIVQRGLERESYSCTPKCQPAISLGDSKQFFEDAGGQTERRNALAQK